MTKRCLSSDHRQCYRSGARLRCCRSALQAEFGAPSSRAPCSWRCSERWRSRRTGRSRRSSWEPRFLPDRSARWSATSHSDNSPFSPAPRIVATLLLLRSRAWLGASIASCDRCVSAEPVHRVDSACHRCARPDSFRARSDLILRADALRRRHPRASNAICTCLPFTAPPKSEPSFKSRLRALRSDLAQATRLIGFIRYACALIALVLGAVAIRRIREPVARVGIAACALPFVVPFFHEHDFVLLLLPALYCAIHARGRTLAFAALASTLCGVDWLGLGQRPNAELQSVLLATACALGFGLLARMRARRICRARRPACGHCRLTDCTHASRADLARRTAGGMARAARCERQRPMGTRTTRGRARDAGPRVGFSASAYR